MMKREDYKAVKHMDKAKMESYLQRIYQRGYQAGVKAMAEEAKKIAGSSLIGDQPDPPQK